MKILLAVDGSKPSLAAAKLLIEHADWYRGKPEVELVTVHLAVPRIGNMRAAVTRTQIERYYQEEGEARLAAAKKLLERSGLAFQARILVGPVAETIARHAKSSRCDLIYLGSQGRTAISDALVGSTASKLLHISDVPVLLAK